MFKYKYQNTSILPLTDCVWWKIFWFSFVSHVNSLACLFKLTEHLVLLVKVLDVYCLETVSCYHMSSINTYYYYYYYYYYYSFIENSIWCILSSALWRRCLFYSALFVYVLVSSAWWAHDRRKHVVQNNKKWKYGVRVLCLVKWIAIICKYVMTLPKLLSETVSRFPAFYGARRIITVFTRARRLYLSEARRIQTTPTHISRTPTAVNLMSCCEPASIIVYEQCSQLRF